MDEWMDGWMDGKQAVTIDGRMAALEYGRCFYVPLTQQNSQCCPGGCRLWIHYMHT